VADDQLENPYWTLDNPNGYSRDGLRDLGRDTQIDVMVTWFGQHYEDPAERTPYESAEGGYSLLVLKNRRACPSVGRKDWGN